MSIFTLCTQTPVGKKTKKANNKAMSPVPIQTEPGDKVSPQDIIPHLVLNLTGKDYRSVTELLKASTLPPLEEVWLTCFFLFFAVNGKNLICPKM